MKVAGELAVSLVKIYLEVPSRLDADKNQHILAKTYTSQFCRIVKES